jgi:hypothetical protein
VPSCESTIDSAFSSNALKELRRSHENELDQLRRKLQEKSADLDDFLKITNEEIDTENRESLKNELSSLNERIEDQSDFVRELEAAIEVLKTSPVENHLLST